MNSPFHSAKRSSTFSKRSAVFPKRSAVWLSLLISAFQLFSISAFADLTNTWEFTNAVNYEVSDPTLIRANPADGGRAELILQEALQDRSSIPQYLTNSAFSGLRLGSEKVIELATDSGGKYVAPGTFRSRIIDKGEGSGSWDALFSKVSNAFLANSPGTVSTNADGLVGLFRLDNDNWVDYITGAAGSSGGTPPSFTTDAAVGSHAGNIFNGYRVYSDSQHIDGLNRFSVTFWVYPTRRTLAGGFVSTYSPSSRVLIGFLGDSQRLDVQVQPSASVPRDRLALPDTVPVPLNKWTLISVVYDKVSGVLNVYYDTTLVGTLAIPATSDAFQQDGPLYLGTSGNNPNAYIMRGFLDDVAIWAKALTQDEIAAIYNNLRSVQFRVRSSPDSNLTGDFVGPDGSVDSFYLGVADVLSASGNFNPIHRYLQYEAKLFTDGRRLETPKLQYAKFITRDGNVFTDSTGGDLIRAESLSGLVTRPASSYTPYFGLSRNLNGGFRTSGTYRSAPIDGGNNAVWEQMMWRLPGDIGSDDPGLVAIYHLDGNWVDSRAGNNPETKNNDDFLPSSRLGFKAAFFSEATGGSTISGFFSVAKSISTLSFWLRPQEKDDGILSVGGGTISIRDHQVVTDGYGANSPQIYVNSNPQDAYLRPGWNHVALVWPSAIDAQDLEVGRAWGDSLDGLLDELALYDEALTMGRVQVQYYNAHPISSGAPSFRVRAADDLTALLAEPWSASFSDPENATFSVQGRYFQYEASFAGDGSGTPTAGDIRVEGNDGVQSFVFSTDTFAEAAEGEYASTAWYGDEIYVNNYGATDPSNLRSSDFSPSAVLAGLWHFDENPWEISTVLSDSSGRGRPGAPVNGAASSPNARVGFRSGSFDGVDDYVELSQIPEMAGTDFSFGLWFNSSDTGEGALLSTYDDSVGYCELLLNHDGTSLATGKVAFVVNDRANGLKAAVSPASNLNNGTWRHVAGVKAGPYIHLYVDGVRVASTAIGNYDALPAGTPRIMRNGMGDNYLSGNVDEVIAFGSALSPKQVGTIFASGYDTARINTMEFEPVDAGGPTIWQTLRWTSDGIYGTPLSPATGVRGLWHLDDVDPTADASGESHTVTLMGTTPATGVFDQGRYLDGSGDHLRADHSTRLENGTFTVELWVKPESLNIRTLIDKRSGSAGYALYTDLIGRLIFQVGNGTITAGLPLLQDVWQHVAASFDGTTMRLYVNGELRGSAVPVGVTMATGQPFYIGRANGGGQFFRGTVDEVAYHARRLTSTEILDHYRSVAGTMKFQVRAGDTLPLDGEAFYGPDGTTNSFFTRLEENNLVGLVPLVQYMQVKAYIGTDDHRFSPTFYGLSVSASRYPENSPWISPTVAAGFDFLAELLGFDHTRTFAPNTDVRYQISGDGYATASSNRWFFYNGSSGSWQEQTLTNAASVYLNETSTKGEVDAHIGKFYEQVYNATGGVFRFKAFLKSGGDQPVTISNVTVTASEGRIVVEAPNGEERGEKALLSDVPTTIRWSWAGDVSDNLEVAYSLDGYSTDANDWTVIATGVAAGAGGTNSLVWTTPQILPNAAGIAINTNAVVRIRDLNDDTVLDTSDRPFEITQKFKVTEPNGGERWYIGEQNDIRWESAFDLSTRASIYFAPDGDNFFVEDGGYLIEFLATNANASAGNTYPWNTPLHEASLLSTNAKIRVQAPNGAYADASDEAFSLVGIVITSPTAGEKVKRGADDGYDIEWRSIDGGTNVHIDVSLDGGATYETNIYSFVQNADGDNVLNWDVTQPETDDAVLRIRSLTDNRIIGYSEVFTIAGIDVIAPDGGEEWLAGSTQTVEWVAGGAGNTVSLYYTDLYAGTNTVWFPIDEDIPNTLSYDWVVSDRVSPLARVKVESVEDPTLNSISAQNFSIAGVRVTYPNLFGDTLVMGDEATMTHNGAPTRWLRVKLEISYDQATTWNTLGPGAEEWTLRQPFLFTPDFPSRQTKVRATVLGATEKDGTTPIPNVFDLSDEYFTVEGVLAQAPAGGSTNTLGEATEIFWVSAGADPSASLYYSSQGTNNFELIVDGTFNNQTYPGDNPYPWVVPKTLLPSETARIKVVSGQYESITDAFILRGIRITTPVDGDVWDVGSTHPIAWQYAGMDITARGSISLSLDGGTTFQVMEADYDLISIPFYNWTSDADLDPTTNAVVRLEVLASDTAADIGFIADSDPFTLKGIKILAPTNTMSFALGSTNTISFIAAAAGSEVTITYSPDGGATYDDEPIVENLSIVEGLNAFDWAVELDRTPSTNAVITITGSEDSKVSDVFTLSGIRVDRPLQYDIWAVGEFNPIEWVAEVPTPVFNLDLLYEDGRVYPLPQNVTGDSRTYQLPVGAMFGEDSISNVVLRIVDSAGTATGYSDPFRLVSQPIIEIVNPVAGDYIRVGEEIEVTWVKGGSMDPDDFTVWFSGDNFATMEDVARNVTYNPANNTISMPWVVPDRLGETRIMVTNSVNPSLTTTSGVFNIVGAFDLLYPNGADGEEEIYANETKAVTWFTEGTVPFVDIYYKVTGGDWEKVNTEGPIDNNPRVGRYQTFYQWTAPVLRTDSMMLRVQDASYPDPDLFDGTRIGPYDDSDGTFPLKFFTVTWEIGYMDGEDADAVFKELDKLSVTDSAGWSVTGLESPFTTNYPYGTFDTVWYRQFFNDKVDFRWLCEENQTRRLVMQPTDTEPDAAVFANFVYDPGDVKLTIHSWIERGGRILNNPDNTTIHIFDTDGTKLQQLSSENVLANGFFRIEWPNVTNTLAEGETYLARVEVMYNRVIYSAAVTYTLSLAPEFATVETILDRVSDLQTNLTSQVTGLSDLTTAFRDEAMASLGTLEEQSGNILTNVARVSEQMDGFSNTVVRPLSVLSNQLVEIIGPSITNMAEEITDIADATAGDQARILNRPSTVEFGSTNTILYKTTRNLDPGTVRLTVEGAGQFYYMNEVGSGLGIYGVDIIADWGIGSYMISCSDPNASDRMILEVVQEGANSMGELSASLASLEGQFTNITEVLSALSDPSDGLGAMIADIDASISQVESALGSGGSASEAASALDSLLGGGGDGAAESLVNSLAGIGSRIDEIYGESSDASQYALSAKNEAGTAVTAVRELTELLQSGEYSMEAAAERMEAIRSAVDTANTNIENIPEAMGIEAMDIQIQSVAEQIKQMAEQQGFAYEVALKQAEAAEAGGLGGDGADEEAISVLNQNMNEVKVSLEFMQKVLDTELNQPVVQEDWLGVE